MQEKHDIDRYPGLLRPFSAAEALTLTQAAARAGYSTETIRQWCLQFHIGRRLVGQYRVSVVALQLFLDDNVSSLKRYLDGDRVSPDITSTFALCGVPILRPSDEAGKICDLGNQCGDMPVL